jgi:hypothetical protein
LAAFRRPTTAGGYGGKGSAGAVGTRFPAGRCESRTRSCAAWGSGKRTAFRRASLPRRCESARTLPVMLLAFWGLPAPLNEWSLGRWASALPDKSFWPPQSAPGGLPP